MSARNRELLALVPASLLLTAGFAAIFIQQSAELSDVSLTYGAGFLALCLCGHLVIRSTLPYADPYLFPLVAVLACFGLVVIYRIDETLAREQAQWFIVGLILFAATLVFLRDFRVLERYRYTVAAAGLLLLLLPRVPVIGQQVNGAYLGVGIGPISFQPAEFGEDRDRRLPRGLPARHAPAARAGLAPLPRRDDPAAQALRAAAGGLGRRDGDARLHPRPRLVADVLRRLPRAALRRDEPALVRDDRAGPVRARRLVLRQHRRARRRTASTRGATRSTATLYEMQGGSYQIAQSLFAQADGGLFGTGFGQALIAQADGAPILPAPQTDLIYAVITNELGLAGACGLLLVYLMVAERGFKIAMLAQDSFSKLLAAGLTAVFALQVFVIVGGVTKRDPADRRDAAVRLLRRLLDRRELRAARAAAAHLRPGQAARERAMNRPVLRLYVLVIVLFGVLVAFTSRWTVFEAEALRDNALNRRELLQEQKIRRGTIRSADGKVLARAVPPGRRHVRPALPDRPSCSRTRSATRTPRSGAPGSSARATTS